MQFVERGNQVEAVAGGCSLAEARSVAEHAATVISCWLHTRATTSGCKREGACCPISSAQAQISYLPLQSRAIAQISGSRFAKGVEQFLHGLLHAIRVMLLHLAQGFDDRLAVLLRVGGLQGSRLAE